MAQSDPERRGGGGRGAAQGGWRVSLGIRLSFVVLGALSVVFLVLYAVLAYRERARLVSSKAMATAVLVDVFARSLRGPLAFHDDDAIGAEIQNLDGLPDVRSIAVWAEGPDRVAGLGAPFTAQKPDGADETINAVSVTIARPVVSPSGSRIGEVLVEMSLNAELAAFQRARVALLLGAAAMALGTSALLSGLVRHQVVMPLRRLGAAAAALGRGDLGSRANQPSYDEIGDLAAAFNNMAESLQDRELRLESATQNLRELVDHMGQAILAFDASGTIISEASREARRLFGRDDLRGRSIRELLFADQAEFDVDVQAFDEWRALAFATSPDAWDTVSELAPRELALGPHKTQATLEFRPILRHDRVLQVMLLATDVSRERRLEHDVQTKEAEYERRLKAMKRLLLDGSQALVSFVRLAEERLRDSEELVVSSAQVLPTATIDALFRVVHTVRGEARAFDMRELEAALESLEEHLDHLRAEARGSGLLLGAAQRTDLVAALQGAVATLRREKDRFAEATPIGRAIFNQTTVRLDDIAALEALAATTGGELQVLVKRLRARPFGESAALVLESIPSWLALEDKQADVVVEHGDVSIDPDLAPMLPGILAHLVRNAIAHGIESPDERARAGKPLPGRILLSASPGRDGTTLVVEDDGRGVDLERLGIPVGLASENEVAFAPGTTTRLEPSALAGRGVGLDSVRTDLAGIEYAISMATERARFTRFTIRKRSAPGATAEGSS